jgi:hypothetical protein
VSNKIPTRKNPFDVSVPKNFTFTDRKSGIASTFNPGTKPTVKTMPLFITSTGK